MIYPGKRPSLLLGIVLMVSLACGGQGQADHPLPPRPQPTSSPIGSGRWRVDGGPALVRYAPDGKTLLVLAGGFPHPPPLPDPGESPGGSECVLHRLDAANGQRLGRLEATLFPSFSGFSTNDPSQRKPPQWSISPDGRLLAEAAPSGSLRLRELDTGRVRFELGDKSRHFAQLCFSPNGRRLAAVVIPSTVGQADANSSRIGIRLWDVTTGKEVLCLAGDVGAERGKDAFVPGAFTFAPDGCRLAACGTEGERPAVRLWDLEGKKGWRLLAGHQGPSDFLTFSPDGKQLAEVNGKQLRLWNPDTGKQLCTLAQLEGECEAVAFTPDGKRLAACVNSTLRQWDLAGGRELSVLGRDVSAFTFAPDSRTLALTEGRGTIRLVAAEGKELHQWKSPFSPIEVGAWFWLARQGAGWPVAFSPHGHTLAAATRSGLIRRWSVATGKELAPPDGLDAAPSTLAISPDGKLVAAADYGTVTLWDVRTGVLVRRLARLPGPQQRDEAEGDWPVVLAFDSRSKRIAAGWQDGGVTVWDVAAGKPPFASWMHPQPVIALVFSEAGDQLVSACGWHVAWHDLTTGRRVRLWTPDTEPGMELLLAVSPWAAVTHRQVPTRCTLWELATGKPRLPLDMPPANVRLAPDGRFLLALQGDLLALVDLKTGTEVRHVRPTDAGRRMSWIRDFAFAADGKRIAAAGHAGVDVWDAASASPLGQLTGHRGGARAIAFTPDGGLISAGNDLTLLRWDLRSLGEQPAAPERADVKPAAPRALESGRDDLGEPLPTGAMARLGSLRFQHGAPVGELRYLPDGTLLSSARSKALDRYEAFSLWDAATGKRRQMVPVSLETLERGLRLDLGYRQPPRWSVSSDGRVVADAAGATREEGPRIQVRRLATGKLVWEVKDDKESFRFVCFSPDGKRLAAICSGAEGVRLYDAASGLELCRLSPPRAGQGFQPLQLAFAPDGGSLAVVGTGKRHAPVCVYDSAGLRPPLLLPEKSVDLSPVVFTPDSRTVAMVGRPSQEGKARLRLWDAVTGKLLRDLGEHDAAATGLLFSPEGKRLVSQQEQQVQLWNTATGKVLLTVKGEDATAVFSPDGRMLAVGTGVISLYESRTGKLLRQFAADPGAQLVPWSGEYGFTTAQQGLGRAIAFSADGQVLAAAHGQTIRRWSTRTGEEISPLPNHNPIAALAVSADGRRIAAGSCDYVVLWDAGGKVLQRLRLETLPGKKPVLLRCVALSPDGAWVAAGSAEGELTLWGADGTRRWRHQCHKGSVTTLTFVDEGHSLLSTGGDDRIFWHDVTTGGRLRQAVLAPSNPEESDRKQAEAAGVAVAGGLLLARGQTGVQLWKLPSGKQGRTLAVQQPDGPASDYPNLALSPDGRWLAVRVSEDCILLVDVPSGNMLRACGGLSQITNLALSPDGRLLAAAGAGGAVVWETASGSILARLVGHRGAATSVAFSADGRTLVSGGEDSTVVVWDVPALLYKPPTGELSRRQLAELWGQLAGKNAGVAYDAARRLARHPAQAVPLVSRKLPPVPEAGPRVARLIVELDDGSFAVRERASKELSEMGAQAEPALHKALKEELSLELRRRIEMLLEHLRGPATSPEELRALRAVELLEWIGSDDARRVLEGLASGAAEARLTREARAALGRLNQRRP